MKVDSVFLLGIAWEYWNRHCMAKIQEGRIIFIDSATVHVIANVSNTGQPYAQFMRLGLDSACGDVIRGT